MAKNYVTSFRGESYFTPSSNKMHIKDEPVTPVSEDFGNYSLDYMNENDCYPMRKSVSMSDIATLRDDLVNVKLSEKDEVNQRSKRPTGGLNQLSKTKFVSMAEAIYHYHRDTPCRFHSTKPQILRSNLGRGPPGLTVPQSPMLRCKARSRPVHVLSQKEKEEMEFEEIKKYKIKAHPIPKSVKEGPKKLPEVSKKPLTVPEPFHLTEVQKKSINSPQIQTFKARRAPKHIFEKPHVPVKAPVHTTKAVSPKWHYKKSKSVELVGSENSQLQKLGERNHQRLGPIKPEPFSFEKRDEELKKRKEERIKEQIENDRKQASQFKAQPLPGTVKKQIRSEATRRCPSSKTCSGNKENCVMQDRPPC